MSHFAEIDANNIVIRVLVGDNSLPDEGKSWFETNLGGTWIQTSYNATIRKNFAGIGFTYDAALDAFIPPQPYPSWILDESVCQWAAPQPYPTDGKNYEWDEPTLSWLEIGA